MDLLSLEDAKSFNLRLVVSMHRLRSASNPDGLIIIVLISLKDERALTMGCKQHHYWLPQRTEKKIVLQNYDHISPEHAN
jgi:hypothetical protein